ncbi:MucBP domain-containing protein [Listeria sp. FSL L7-1699]|uniref:MucBP domain-containing protein n=1 Tax=Listeria farberi TaxID=2713500 RepID=A0ABR6SM24_9LIST|nr:MucBP domain-containing protein [Listeria farberi]MBC1375207.1 MucBP domain-containing protein [Listeria farberi]MBC1381804.1 MucBP domain-containing protein [Listeria farberi]
MNRLKKLVTILICTLLIVSLLPFSVWAEDQEGAEINVGENATKEKITQEITPNETTKETTANEPISTKSFPTGNYSGDFSINSQKDVIESGQTVNYNIYLKITGPNTSYRNAKLVINLPENGEFTQALNELKIAGVTPSYNKTTRQLVYTYQTLNSGVVDKVILKLSTKNGYTPNGTKLEVTGEFSADNLSEKVTEQAETIVNATATTALSNDFTKVENSINNNPSQGDIGIWSFNLNIPKKSTGSLFIEEGKKIIIEYTLDDKLDYLGVAGDTPEPTKIEGQKLTWEIATPTYLEQEKATSLLNKTFQIRTFFQTTIPNFATVQNKAVATTSFVTLADSIIDTSNASVSVSASDPATIPPTIGSVYAPAHRGPVDADWGIATVTGNPDIKAYDSAKLGFSLMLNSAMNDSPSYDFLYYDVYYNMDDNLKLDYFRSGDFYFKPNINYPGWPKLKKSPKYNLLVKYGDDTDWTTLKEDVELGKMYSRKDLGIPDDKHVSKIWLHFTYAPAGMYGADLSFFTTVKEGYVGEVRNSTQINMYGADSQGYIHYHDETNPWPENWQKYAGDRTAQIIPQPIGKNKFVQGSVAFDDTDGNLINIGDNSVSVNLESNKASISRLTGPFEAMVLLPSGVKMKNTDQEGFNVSVLNSNYQNSGRQLLKVKWDKKTLLPAEKLTAKINVSVSKDTPSNMSIEMFGFLQDTDFNVPEVTGTPTISDTKMEIDSDDINRNGNSEESRITSGNHYILNTSNHLKISKKAKGNRDKEYSGLANATTNSIVSYQLLLENDSDEKIANMVLMDVLPSEKDLGITDNSERGSKFNLELTKAVAIPNEWKDKVEVTYSTAKNPKRAGVLDKHTIYPTGSEPLVDNAEATEADWLTASEVQDWSKIYSFKMELKEGIEWIPGKSMKIQFDLKTPKKNQIGKELLKQQTKKEDRAAWNSFAVAVNNSQVIEPAQVGVALDDSVAPVTVQYVDQNHKQIASPETLTGAYGEKFTAKQKKIANYTLVKTPANVSGTFNEKAQTVTFIYQKVTAGSIIVDYVDKDGAKLADSIVLTGNLNSSYRTSAKKISGYKLYQTPKNAMGKFLNTSQKVTYVYEKTSALSVSSNEGTENGKKPAKLPQTGDSKKNNLWFILGLLLLSSTFVIMKKK